MARDLRWNPSLADLAVLVVGFALSAASLRFTFAAEPPATTIKIRNEWRYAAVTSLFLSPLGWATAGLAMTRTDRRRWIYHPAVVLGLASFTLAIVELVSTISSNMGLSRVLTFQLMTMLYGTAVLAVVAKFLIAWFFIFGVVGRLRWPDDWLSVAGWTLGCCWVGGHVALVVARFF